MTFLGESMPVWVRLIVAIVATIHALLCARVILTRIIRFREPAHPERVPTAAMLAYGIICGHIARILLIRLSTDVPVEWGGMVAYIAALAAGSVAFAQIVVLTRRDRRGS